MPSPHVSNLGSPVSLSVQRVPTTFTTRRWQLDDVPFLWDMLYDSIHVPDGDAPLPRSILLEHDIAHYLEGFGRERDDAQIAVDEAGARIGAAWCRTTTAADPGYGFVAEDIPELGTAIVAAWRGRGVGSRLIEELADRNPALSLSVDDDNESARRLYLRLGFVPLGVNGTATTMLRRPRS